MATLVGARSPLFYKKVKGGLAAILDGSKYTGNIFFVDSAVGTDGDGYGSTPDAPFATIDYAVGKCIANQGDVIIVLPGHTETVVAAGGLDLDVAGITVIGLGAGASRATINFTTLAGADVDVDAANITLKGFLLTCSIDEQTIMVDVNADDFTIEDCEFRGSATAQPLTCVDNNGGAANAADRMVVRRCKFISYTAAASANRAVELGEVNDEILIEDNIIDGDWGDAGIHNPTGKVLTNLRITDNIIRNRQAGDHAVELVSACTGEASGNMLFADTPGVVFDPGSLFCANNWESSKIDSGATPSPAGLSAPEWVHVAKAAAALPATTTQTIFTVAGGRVLVKLLLGEVTTIIQAQITNLKVTGAPTTGTAVDLAANLDINGKEAGTLLLVEGDGTALVGANAGAALSGVGYMGFIVPIGVIRIETGATSTGATKWDVWYVPLDAGARVS